jgi:hypothetical protein
MDELNKHTDYVSIYDYNGKISKYNGPDSIIDILG